MSDFVIRFSDTVPQTIVIAIPRYEGGSLSRGQTMVEMGYFIGNSREECIEMMGKAFDFAPADFKNWLRVYRDCLWLEKSSMIIE